MDNPQLGSLVNNGGTTLTMLPLVGSRLLLVLSNLGSGIKGLFTINYYASRTPGVGGSLTLLATVTKKLSIRGGGVARVSTVIKSLPASLPAGSYFLVAEMIDPTKLNAAVTTSGTIAVAAPFVRLSAVVGTVVPAVIASGKSGVVSLTITNNGNVAAAGVLSMIVNPSADGAMTLPVELATFKAKVSISAGRHLVVRLRVKIPPSLGAGDYFPYCSVTLNDESAVAIGSVVFGVD